MKITKQLKDLVQLDNIPVWHHISTLKTKKLEPMDVLKSKDKTIIKNIEVIPEIKEKISK